MVVDPLPLKKAKTNGKRQRPHDDILNDDTDQIDNIDSWPVLDPLQPKKAEKNGKRQPHKELLSDDSWPTLDPLPPKKKRSVGLVYLSKEAFKASRTPVRVPVVVADDKNRKRVPAKVFDIYLFSLEICTSVLGSRLALLKASRMLKAVLLFSI